MFYNLQFGFRAGRSVHDAIFCLVDRLWGSRNTGLYSSVAFLDLSKAFNCVQHDVLLEKLEHYGVKGMCHKWLTSYLKDRMQFTQINEFVSNVVRVGSGVPQGSVLGPILYLIYVNDINYIGLDSMVIMFADDSVLISSHKDPVSACRSLESDILNVSNYFADLKLKLNQSKTKILNIDVRIRNPDPKSFP